MYKLDIPLKTEYPILLNVWESSARATHHFLQDGEIENIKKIIQEKEVFDHIELTVARDSNNNIVGIMGVSENSIEMLFVKSSSIGKGVGKALILHAIDHLKVNRVDVNEQNELALKFYERFGFKIISRSPMDDHGLPYPILHMQL